MEWYLRDSADFKNCNGMGCQNIHGELNQFFIMGLTTPKIAADLEDRDIKH